MTRLVNCVILKREAPGLPAPPHPGDLGIRVFENVSQEAWDDWLQRLQMIINENQLNTADPRSIELIEDHMLGYFFGEGELGGLPQGFHAPGAKK